MALPILVSRELHSRIVEHKKKLNDSNLGLRVTINDLCSNWVIKGIKKNRFKLNLVVKVEEQATKKETYGTIIINESAAEMLMPAVEKARKKLKVKRLSICDYVSVMIRLGLSEGTTLKTKVLA